MPRMSDAASNRLPAATLDPKVIRLWRIDEAVKWAFAVVAGVAGGAVARSFDIPVIAITAVVAAILALAAADVLLVPRWRWRRWRYEIGDLEVDLAYGLWTHTRARIPMARIQHVDTTQGPLERHFDIATVVLSTAAGAHTIPGLRRDNAAAVRDRVAALANTRDDV
jgi:membrane protein YdbS with pleckstrin-like domain